jgi:deoxyribodipyrimidine photo-lyase
VSSMQMGHLAAPPSRRVIWWIRRDLRLSDNQALQAALQAAGEVIPLFILDPALLGSAWVGLKRTAFLFAGLQALDADLRRRGGRLIIRQGDPLQVLAEVFAESRAEALFAEPDVSPYAHRRDSRVEKALPVSWVGSPALRPPGTVLKSNGEPYTVFTPFSRAWKALPGLDGLERSRGLFAAPNHIPVPAGLTSLPLPEPLDPPAGFPAGEAEAQRRLEFFTRPADGEWPLIESYAAGRDRLDLEGTAQLSPYLRFGMLSARQAVAAALGATRAAPDPEARLSAETWLNELIWREFYLHVLEAFPRLRRENYRLPGVRWQNDPQAFQSWCEGRTGYPAVDAAMRQLVQSGWMHNRARMIVASFLTKDLLIDWRWGERFFMQHLVDGDPAANNGGWQWAAGTGMDAAPYFRIFNPVSQGLRHDPEGVYIRRWLPELRSVPLAGLHQPWLMSAAEQQAAGCWIGVDYPAPIVEHSAARQRALAAYRGG